MLFELCFMYISCYILYVNILEKFLFSNETYD